MAALIFTGPDGQAIDVPIHAGRTRLGREEGNEILVPHDSVSSWHCELDLDDAGQVEVRDLGSTNGTSINGVAVSRGILRNGDLLRVGDVECQLQLQGAAVPVPMTRMPAGPSGVPGGSCMNHPSVPATWKCGKCGLEQCDACVVDGRSLGVRGVKFCPACRSIAKPIQSATAGASSSPQNFVTELFASWKYPFRGDGPIIMAAGAVFFAVAAFAAGLVFLLGILVAIFATGYWMAYAQKVVCCSAQGENEPPTWPDFSDFASDILLPFFHAFGLFALYLLPVFVVEATLPEEELSTSLISGGLLLLALFMMPMAWLAISMHESITGLSPHFVIPSILRIPGQYLVVFVELVVLVGVQFLLEIGLERLAIPLVGPLLSSFLSVYFLLVICRLLGVLYYLNKDRLRWF